MSGNYSRRKGMRNEYLLRDELRRLGFTADRVPSSGAAEGFKGDIRFSRDGKTYLAELKCRKNTFSKVYQLLSSTPPPIFGVSVVTPAALELISVSYSIDEIIKNDVVYPPAGDFSRDPHVVAGIRRLITLKKLLGPCDILVVRDDRNRFIYIRYR